MSDVHAYRASDELAAALRQWKKAHDLFTEQVREFDEAHPGHELLWRKSGLTTDQRPVGFRDGEDEVPAGLSRAKTRTELRPKKTKAGQEWQAILDRFSSGPQVSPVFQEFGVPTSAMGGMAPTGGTYVSPTQWADADVNGVIVVNGNSLDTAAFGGHAGGGRGEHLTKIPLSEFYAIKERLEAEQAVAS